MTGRSASTTVTLKEHVCTFDDASVTAYVTVVVPRANAVPDSLPAASVVTAPAQLSVPTGRAKVTRAEHIDASVFTVCDDGQLIAGACMSATTTLNVHVALLFAASVAWKPTVAVPTAKAVLLPLPRVCMLCTPAQLSQMPTAPNATAVEHWSWSLTVLILAGQVMRGGCVSRTVTMNEHDAHRPAASVVLYATCVTPTGNVAPLCQPPASCVRAPAQLSVPVGSAYVIVWLHWFAALTWSMFDGHTICGASASTTSMLNEHVALLPGWSVAMYCTTCIPTSTAAPLAGPCARHFHEPGQLSVFCPMYVTTALHALASLLL